MSTSPSLQKVRNQVREKVVAQNLAEQSNGSQKKLIDGIAIIPERKLLDDAQYLLNDLLPRILNSKGEASQEYKFFRGLVDSLTYCLKMRSMYETLLARFQREQFMGVIYREKAELYEAELLKYKTVEDLIQAEVMNDYRNAILQQAEVMLKELSTVKN